MFQLRENHKSRCVEMTKCPKCGKGKKYLSGEEIKAYRLTVMEEAFREAKKSGISGLNDHVFNYDEGVDIGEIVQYKDGIFIIKGLGELCGIEIHIPSTGNIKADVRKYYDMLGQEKYDMEGGEFASVTLADMKRKFRVVKGKKAIDHLKWLKGDED